MRLSAGTCMWLCKCARNVLTGPRILRLTAGAHPPIGGAAAAPPPPPSPPYLPRSPGGLHVTKITCTREPIKDSHLALHSKTTSHSYDIAGTTQALSVCLSATAGAPPPRPGLRQKQHAAYAGWKLLLRYLSHPARASSPITSGKLLLQLVAIVVAASELWRPLPGHS
jgi:hypothetical protein